MKKSKEKRGQPAKVIAFVNQKGGVAKTTSCLNIGAALAIEGKRVLLVDLDPQGSLTKCAGVRDLDSQDATTYEILKGAASINDAVKLIDSKAYYELVPTDLRMSKAEIELIGVPGRDFLLKKAIESLKEPYDYVLIDCNPSLSILTLMALTAASSVIIPVAAQYMPLDGVAQLLDTIGEVQKYTNERLKVGGVLITIYDGRRSLDKEIVELIRSRFKDETFKTVVKYNSKLAEAPTFGKDIFDYDPKSPGAEAYSEIAKEIIKREV